MRKQVEARDENKIRIIPEYGRQRLLTYAESFRDLADLFEKDEAESSAEGRDGLSVAAQIAGESGASGRTFEGNGAYHVGGGQGDLSVPANGRAQIQADLQASQGVGNPAKELL